jgi:hypothetical protein
MLKYGGMGGAVLGASPRVLGMWSYAVILESWMKKLPIYAGRAFENDFGSA